MKRLAALLVLLSATTASASFCGGYTYQRTLTVNASQVSNGTLNYTNFPVLISTNEVTLSTTPASGGHLVTGYDFIISSDSLCQFPVSFDTETVQNVGVSTANVYAKLDFSSSTNRTYYLTYGNAAITSYQGTSTNTWDSNYLGVYHYNDASMVRGQFINDATVNKKNMFISGTGDAIQTPGEVDGSANYNSASQYNGAASSVTLSGITGAVTLEAWFYLNTTHTYDSATNDIINVGDGVVSANFIDLSINSGDGFVGAEYCYFSSGFICTNTSSAAITTGTWYHFVLTYDNSSTLKLYTNGVLTASSPIVGGTRTRDGQIEVNNGSRNGRFTDMKMDEFRYSNIARSADWIKTTYNNQSSPTTFITIGPETTSSVSAVNTNQVGLVINGGKLVVNGVQLIIK